MKPSAAAYSRFRSSRPLILWLAITLLMGVLPALPADEVDAQQFSQHTVIKYECDPGYDPSSGNAQSAFDNCQTPAEGVNFTLSTQDPNYPGSSAATNGSGQASWGDIPFGTAFTVTESVPPGYGTPWVYCEVSGNPDNPGDTQTSYFQAGGGVMDVGITDSSLTAYAQSTCSWFNVPPA